MPKSQATARKTAPTRTATTTTSNHRRHAISVRRELPICLIILAPSGHTIPEGDLRAAYADNPDAWGLMARNPQTKEVFVARGAGKDGADALVAAYTAYAKPGYEVAIHCRIGTSGTKDIRNSHPFEVTDGLWMMHNGMIKVDRAADLTYCDSYHYAKKIGAQFGPNVFASIRNLQVQDAIATEIGYSKLVFMDAEGVTIVGEELGEWKNDLWYSNDSLWSSFVYHGSNKMARGFKGEASAFGALDDEEATWWADQYAGERQWSPIAARSERIKSRRAEFKNATAVIDSILWMHEIEIDDLALEVYDNPEAVAEVLYALLHGETPGMKRLPNKMRTHLGQQILDARFGIDANMRASINEQKQRMAAPVAPNADTLAIAATAAAFGETTEGGEQTERSLVAVS